MHMKSFSLCIFLLLSLASSPPYMVLVYLLPSPSFKCNRLFHLKMCWFCKTPLSQNWGGHFCPAESKEKSPSSVGSVMQECLSARQEDAITILIRGGGEISSRSNFYQPPPPHIPLPRIKQSPAQARCTLTDESRFMCVCQWGSTFKTYRDTQKPHLSLSHCFNFLRNEDKKKQRRTCRLCKSLKSTKFIRKRRKRGHICCAGECERWCHARCMEAIHCKCFSRWTENTLLYYLGETVAMKRPPAPSAWVHPYGWHLFRRQTCPQGGAEWNWAWSLFQGFGSVEGDLEWPIAPPAVRYKVVLPG